MRLTRGAPATMVFSRRRAPNRCRMSPSVSCVSTQPVSNLRRWVIVGATLLFALVFAGCGGSDGATGDTDGAIDGVIDTEDSTGAATPIPEDDPDEPVVVPTSTPVPTPTPLPTATPIPLDAPTPSAILLDAAFTNNSKVTTVGIDEVFFGMTAEESAEAASTEWVGDPSPTSNCYQVVPSNGPDGVTLWIVDGRVERLDIEHPDIRTPSQLGLGNTLDQLQSQLGDRLSSETDEAGTTIATFTPSDPGDREFRIIFELVDDQVARYRSGRIGIVDRAADGC